MNERIVLAMWRNDKRERPTQPPLKGGKPVTIDGRDYWVSAYVNGPKDGSMDDAINRMIDKLSEGCGTYPIVKVSLTPADGPQQYRGQQQEPPPYNDDIGF